MNKLHFTKAIIESIPLPTKATYYADAKVEGLNLRISPTGARTWSVFKWSRAQRRPMRVSIGPYPSFPIDLARRKAIEIISAVDQGRDLQQEKREKFAIPTLGELNVTYRQRLAALDRRHPGYIDQIIRLSCGDWFNRRVNSITQREMSERHDKIALERGKVAAARTIKALRTLINHAQVDLGLDVRNVARVVRVSDSTPRGRYLSNGEEAKLRTVLQAESQDVQDYFRLLMLTGARRDNVAGMRWADVDLIERVWTIPSALAKAGRPIIVPLVDEAVTILQVRRALHSDDAVYCFPSRGRKGRIVEVWYMLKRLKARAVLLDLALDWRVADPIAEVANIDSRKREGKGLGDLTVHDLRRTLAVRLVSAGASLPVIAAALGHKNLKTTQQVYALATEGDVRAAFERIHHG